MQGSNKKASLLVDLYELAMAAAYLRHKKNSSATFELFIRDLPKSRSYFMAAGLEDCLRYLEWLCFDDDDIAFLKTRKLFDKDFLDYLKTFRFKADVWAIKEGEIFFPNEPILRVTGGIIEAQIVESFLLNTVNFQTMLATKAARIVQSAEGRPVFDFSLRRTHGFDAAVKAARSAYIAGCAGTSNVLSGYLYGIPIVGTMAHSFVMSFKKEVESFRAFASVFPDRTTFLIDTYNTIKGAVNAVKAAKELEKKGFRLKAVRLDSGDIAALSKKVRRILDSNGLSYVGIFASGNLDEYKISNLLEQGAEINSFGVGTSLGTSSDAPYCDVIYKISEVKEKNIQKPVMKLSSAKVTYPGRKEVYRVCDRRGFFMEDIIAEEGEKPPKGGRPLLEKVMAKGSLVRSLPTLDKIRDFASSNISMLPEKYRKLYPDILYPVKVSAGLRQLALKIAKEIERHS